MSQRRGQVGARLPAKDHARIWRIHGCTGPEIPPGSGFLAMENAIGTNHRVRFKAFELDLHTRELFRNGIRLRVQGQPIEVLEMLLERPGELVTRERLRKKLWPEDTFVDFEHSLNSTIARLRDALGDRAEEPKYIETLPRLGYRFVAAVETENDRVPLTRLPGTAGGDFTPVVAAESPISGMTPQVSRSPVSDTNGMKPGSWLRRRWRWVFAAVVLAATGITVAWWEWWSLPSAPHVTSIDVITNDGVPKSWPVTDGSRIYYGAYVKSRSVLAQISSAGGETSIIPTPFAHSPGLADISPDNSSLLVVDNGSLWIVPLPQGPPRKVGNVVADDASWTPDGKRVIFTRAGELWISDADGSQMRKLWTSPGNWAVTPRVSPDREHIRLSVCGLHGCALWEAGIDGSGAHRMLAGWQNSSSNDAGGWSPDGRFYIFGSITPGAAFHENIWALPERRGWLTRGPVAPVQLTQGPLCFFPSVAFSHDGKTLFAIGKKDASELVRYDPVTRKAASLLPGIPATYVDFSRDGQWMSYVTTPYRTLWRCRRDGSERVQLTSSIDSLPGISRWSPDGSRIAFEQTPASNMMFFWRGGTKLALISRDGGLPEQLIPDNEDNLEQEDPTWSPDGNEIIFARDASVTSADRMKLMRVEIRTRKVTPVPGSEGLYSPRWSPDGRYLAAFSVDSHTIRLFDFQKHLWTTWFTAGQGTVGWNLWSPDGRSLYFLKNKMEDAPLAWWRIGVGEQKPTKIMDLPDDRIVPESWYSLGPDGGSYFSRDLSSLEIYALHLSEK